MSGWAHLQDLTFETDDLDAFGRVLAAAIDVCGATHLTIADQPIIEYPSQTAAYLAHFLGHEPFSFAWRPPDQRGPAHYQLVCVLGRVGDEPLDGVARVLELLRAADVRGFLARTGAGPFRGADGTTEPGYRLRHSATYGSDAIGVMLCHIYLSK